ncbi:MAG TPA: hypothetical protein VNK52_05785 [Hyphomicrobiaceae bacterium]|nr:hypothetical protein [Hyphomicrobiaceae bacterium]
MAKIWPVYEGKEPTRGDPWVDVPVSDAIALCDLRTQDFVSDLSNTPRFGDTGRDLWYAGFTHVVVEIDVEEARAANWKPGLYRSRLEPKEVFRRLIEQPLVAALGRDKVLRVEVAPTLDAEGRGAMLTTIVITPDAIQRLDSEAEADAEARLRERLHEMHVAGTPIMNFATEAELAEDVGS